MLNGVCCTVERVWIRFQNIDKNELDQVNSSRVVQKYIDSAATTKIKGSAIKKPLLAD